MKSEPVNITQDFTVSKTELFSAWTEESALKSWWKPTGRTLSSVENEIKEGGKITYEFEDGDESTGQLTIEGEYKTALPEEKLVYTWNWIVDNEALENGNYLLTVEFTELDGGSQISITQEKQSEDEGIHPHKEGWEEALESLKTYLER